VVASAGNSGINVPSYPAAYDGVISVSATTVLDELAFYSNFGAHVDVAAPGGQTASDQDGDNRSDGVVSTIGFGGGDTIEFRYGLLQGTSMAAPHVSGVIALMKSVYPELTPGEFDALLQGTALTDDAGEPGRDDRFGWGIINALDAVLAAQNVQGGNLGPIISVSTGTLNFRAFTEELDFAVTNVGDEAVGVTVVADQPWLIVSPIAIDQDGFGEYRASVDRTNLPDGSYTATITIRPQNHEQTQAASLHVIMQVTSPDVNADAGQHYVILASPEDQQSVAVQIVTATNGEYTFALQDVAPGRYRLFAGTDLDDDDFICDGGEACGAFPSLASPEIIDVDPRAQPEIADRSFASEFRSTATTTPAPGGATSDNTREGLVTVKPGRPR
jgi:serine protease